MHQIGWDSTFINNACNLTFDVILISMNVIERKELLVVIIEKRTENYFMIR